MEEKTLRHILADELSKQLSSYGFSKRTISTEEKARQLGINPETLRRKARAGEIPCLKTGNGEKARYRFFVN